jgi:hypothetical protein
VTVIPVQGVIDYEVVRDLEASPPSVVLGFEDTDGRRVALEIRDVDCYALIRKMTKVLFSAE